MDFTKERQRLNFLVYIIESPSAPDLYHKKSEAEILSKALLLCNICSVSRLAVNSEAFKAAMTIGIEEYLKQPAALPPIIHISAHGFRDGIQLTSGEIVTWTLLSDMLIPINKALNGLLLICLSSCEGWNGCTMAMTENEMPFMAMVGSILKPTWSDTAIGFSSFYHLLSKGYNVFECVEGMQYAAGNNSFIVEHGQTMKEIYLNELGKVRQKQMLESLQKYLPKVEDSQLVKEIRNLG